MYISLSFTFHYVSISTHLVNMPYRTRLHLHSTMYLFQPAAHNNALTAHIDLHSTMYLFQRNTKLAIIHSAIRFTFHYVSISTNINISRKGRNFIYIPLCIYFNPELELINTSHNTFTFHYVSISTLISCIMILSMKNLHSTMYLFQLHHTSDR